MARCVLVLVCIIKSVLCCSASPLPLVMIMHTQQPRVSHGLCGGEVTQCVVTGPHCDSCDTWHRSRDTEYCFEYMSTWQLPTYQLHINTLLATDPNDEGGGVRSSQIKCCIIIISLLCGRSHSSSGHQCFCPCCLLLHRVLVIPDSQHRALLLCPCSPVHGADSVCYNDPLLSFRSLEEETTLMANLQ